MTREELEEVIYERTRDFAEVRVMDCILELIAAEREAEREACAKLCEIVWHSRAGLESGTAFECAQAIRARGGK
jgi:hypothetical protein